MIDKEKDYYENYNYNDRKPVYIEESKLRSDQSDRLTKSAVFCMMPWIHLHGFPDGRAYPCCHAVLETPVGDLKKEPMEIIWNSDEYKNMRQNMLNDKPCRECTNCYEKEASGFVSGRHSANKHFGHHIELVDQTEPDGTFNDFKLRYYDIRFSNLCNMSCRTCGSLFSSSWYGEETKLFGPRSHPQIMFAGRTENDMWEQLLPHIPYIEQIYFAGGEPLIMEEHYRLLKELVRQERFDVKIIYNTNFSRLNLKDEDVLDYWRLFKSVSVGASLDGMGTRGEYIRKGTKWDDIVRNRERMIEKCPNVDFYVSSTVSIYNAFHISDFHRDWIERGFINPQDWNINILQSPTRDRIDALPEIYKKELEQKILQHIYWLRPKDKLKRATNGYKSMITYMYQNDNTHYLKEFFRVNDQVDQLRKESFEEVFSEYKDLRKYAI
jgi:organic radical activating enzyme